MFIDLNDWYFFIFFFDIVMHLLGLCCHCLCPQIPVKHRQVWSRDLFFSLMKKGYMRESIDFIQTSSDRSSNKLLKEGKIAIIHQVQQKNCLDHTELLPKQQEHSYPDKWSYMLAHYAKIAGSLSKLEPSLCHNNLWSSSCNTKCCFCPWNAST